MNRDTFLVAPSVLNGNGTAHLKKCKQLIESQHLLCLTKRHLMVKVLIYI
jgi:hypothetical protein